MNTSIYLLIPITIALLTGGCTAEDPADLLSDIPEIELLNVSPTQVVAFQDSIVFQIRYTDGDGDLGSNNDQDRNVFVTDKRINAVHGFRLRQLAPDGESIPITGTFNIILPNTLITDNSQQQAVSFSIYVVDRAGHESNTVESGGVIVVE